MEREPRPAAVRPVSMRTQAVRPSLKSGRDGPPRSEVMDIQRARIVAAAIDTLEGRGYAAMTVAAVIGRARVSRKTFYEVFANRDECFMAAVDEVFTKAHSVASAAYAPESGWLAATRSSLDSLLCLIDDEPGLARIWFVETLAGPDAVLDYRARATAEMVAAIDRGRGEAGERAQPPALAAEAAVGGMSHIIYSRLTSESSEPFAALLGPFMYLIAFPYLGAPRARAELRRTSERVSGPQPVTRRRRRELLQGMNIRLTHRTIRALDAVSNHPGASNRVVADECGIQDQGQISKLLARLERRALIENRGLGQRRGGTNSWHITERGSEILRTTNVYGLL